MQTIRYSDLKRLAESNKVYSFLISPFTLGAAVNLFFFLATEYRLLAIVAGVIAFVVVLAIHHALGWSTFKSNWQYCYIAHLNGIKYHIVKDGARRVRVIRDDDGSLEDIRDNLSYYNSDLKDWLSAESTLSEEYAEQLTYEGKV